MGYDENDLLQDFNQGSQRAYTEIYRRYYQKLTLFSEGIVHHSQESEDVAIMTLMKLFQHKPVFAKMAELENWLFLSARNRSIDVLRRRAARKIRNDDFDLDDQANNELDHELAERAAAYLEKLAPQTRKVIILRFMEGKKFKEIARDLNISPRTAEGLVNKAITRARKSLLASKLIYAAPLVTTPILSVLKLIMGFLF